MLILETVLIQIFSCFGACLYSKIFESCLSSKRCLLSREYVRLIFWFRIIKDIYILSIRPLRNCKNKPLCVKKSENSTLLRNRGLARKEVIPWALRGLRLDSYSFLGTFVSLDPLSKNGYDQRKSISTSWVKHWTKHKQDLKWL